MAGYRWQYVNLDDCIVRYHNHGSSGKEDLEYLTFDLLKCIGKEYKPLFAINRDYSQFVILCYVFPTYQFITYQWPTCSAYREKKFFYYLKGTDINLQVLLHYNCKHSYARSHNHKICKRSHGLSSKYQSYLTIRWADRSSYFSW